MTNWAPLITLPSEQPASTAVSFTLPTLMYLILITLPA
ncbi:MAG: hypothetical protein ACJAUP_002531 [Cellvibrionaceae bacterium]